MIASQVHSGLLPALHALLVGVSGSLTWYCDLWFFQYFHKPFHCIPHTSDSFCILQDFLSSIDDPERWMFWIFGHVSWLPNLFSHIFDPLLVELQEVCNIKKSLGFHSRVSGCGCRYCNISDPNGISEVGYHFIFWHDCLYSLIFFSLILYFSMKCETNVVILSFKFC